MISVQNFRDECDTHVVASFDVYWEEAEITFYRMKLLRGSKGGYFLSYPSYRVEENGSKKWFPYFQFSASRKREFEKNIFEELQVFLPQFTLLRS